MATVVPGTERARRLAELDERERAAWREYREGLRDLRPKAYDDEEPAAWEQLQATLRIVAGEREALGSGR